MKFALGTVKFGMDYGIQGAEKPSEEAVEEMLSYALEKGISQFDTASAYGGAETVLGHYIEKNSEKICNMHIISKLRPKIFMDKPTDLWKDIVLKNIQESLIRLKISRLEAFLFHSAEYIFDEAAVNALHCVCGEGLAEKIGVSIYTPEEALKALEYEEIKVVQVPYNVFDHRLDCCGFFEKAKEKQVEVYARSSLLQGLILMDPNRLPKRVRFAENYLKRFVSICKDYDILPLKAAVCYVKRHLGIDYVVFGVDNQSQLYEYISMQEEEIPIDMVETLKREFEDVEDRLVNPVLWS